jgi:DNA-binding MarR family transcriptional regulator
VSTLSSSLRALEKRGLVKRTDAAYGRGVKRRTSHVQLTDVGRAKALARRADPRTWQEKRAAKKAEFMENFKVWQRERTEEEHQRELVDEIAKKEWEESAECKAIAEQSSVEAALSAENIELSYIINLKSEEMGLTLDPEIVDELDLEEFRRRGTKTFGRTNKS